MELLLSQKTVKKMCGRDVTAPLTKTIFWLTKPTLTLLTKKNDRNKNKKTFSKEIKCNVGMMCIQKGR